MKLIDKAALVGEIEKYISNYRGILNSIDKSSDDWVDSTLILEPKIDVLQHILFFLDTLEVKEVDLEKEFDKCCENYIFDDECEVYTAKHFFELGFKAQKGK